MGLLEQVAADNPSLVPYGTNFKAPVYCWNDQWPFAAEGIPGMRLGTSNPTVLEPLPHQLRDHRPGRLRVPGKDRQVHLPRRLATGARPAAVRPAGARRDARREHRRRRLARRRGGRRHRGAPRRRRRRLLGGLRRLRRRQGRPSATSPAPTARCWRSRRPSTTTSPRSTAGTTRSTRTSRYCDDVQQLNASLAALGEAVVDPDAAAGPLWDVGQMYYGLVFSYDAFVDDQQRHAPDYYRICLGRPGPAGALPRPRRGVRPDLRRRIRRRGGEPRGRARQRAGSPRRAARRAWRTPSRW